jgi:hypothetical protein
MKRLGTFVLASILGLALATSAATPAAAQPLCNTCCAQNGVPICSGWVLACGAPCRCAGVWGVGFAC